MGGFAGRIKHLSEIPEYTINDIRNILNQIATQEILIKEKLDGINICFTVKDGECFFARNKTDVSRGGLSLEEHIERYKNHPASKPFIDGAKSISKIFLSNKDLSRRIEKTLASGHDQQYLNAEIICKDHVNIISYKENYISIHNIGVLNSSDARSLVRCSNNLHIYCDTYRLVFNDKYRLNLSIRDYSRFLSALENLDVLDYDNNITLGKIIEQNLKKDLGVEDIKPYSDYVLYGKGKARELLKSCKLFSIASSKEKARKYRVKSVADIHTAIQKVADSLISNTTPLLSRRIERQPYNITTEGFVFCHNENTIKLTGKFQDINQACSIAR